MKLVVVNNIIPYLIAYVKSDMAILVPFNSWGAEDFMPWDLYSALDLDTVDQDENIRLCEDFPHNNSYGSDEVHHYMMVIFKGDPVLLAYKFGDRVDTHSRILNTEKYAEFHAYLITHYIKTPECSGVDDKDSDDKISRSYLQAFIEYDGSLYAAITDPTWGGRPSDLTKTEVRILSVDDDDEVIDRGRLMSSEYFYNPTIASPWRKDALRGKTDTGFEFEVFDWDESNNLVFAVKVGHVMGVQ